MALTMHTMSSAMHTRSRAVLCKQGHASTAAVSRPGLQGSKLCIRAMASESKIEAIAAENVEVDAMLATGSGSDSEEKVWNRWVLN